MNRSIVYRRIVRAALLAGVLTLVVPGLAWPGTTLAEQALGEAQVKAAFLLNFAKFIQWPDRPAGPIVIGIAGDDAFAQVVSDTVRGRSVDGRPFETRVLASGDDPSNCQIVFIAVMRPAVAAEWLQRARGHALTVGETVQFLRDGGVVRLYSEAKRVRFQINQRNAEAAGLKVSAQLLMLSAR